MTPEQFEEECKSELLNKSTMVLHEGISFYVKWIINNGALILAVGIEDDWGESMIEYEQYVPPKNINHIVFDGQLIVFDQERKELLAEKVMSS